MSSSWDSHLRATGRHLPYGITQCYLPPDTSEGALPYPQPVSRYSIYLLRGMEGWVDLGYLAMHRPGVKPVISQSITLTSTPPSHPSPSPPSPYWGVDEAPAEIELRAFWHVTYLVNMIIFKSIWRIFYHFTKIHQWCIMRQRWVCYSLGSVV